LGTDIGGFINRSIPDFAITLIFLGFNLYVLPKTVKKAFATWKFEKIIVIKKEFELEKIAKIE